MPKASILGFHGKPFLLHGTINKSQVSNTARDGFKLGNEGAWELPWRITKKMQVAGIATEQNTPVKNMVQIQSSRKKLWSTAKNTKMQIKQPAG